MTGQQRHVRWEEPTRERRLFDDGPVVYDVYEYDDDYVDQYGNTYNHSEVPQFQPAGRRGRSSAYHDDNVVYSVQSDSRRHPEFVPPPTRGGTRHTRRADPYNEYNLYRDGRYYQPAAHSQYDSQYASENPGAIVSTSQYYREPRPRDYQPRARSVSPQPRMAQRPVQPRAADDPYVGQPPPQQRYYIRPSDSSKPTRRERKDLSMQAKERRYQEHLEGRMGVLPLLGAICTTFSFVLFTTSLFSVTNGDTEKTYIGLLAMTYSSNVTSLELVSFDSKILSVSGMNCDDALQPSDQNVANLCDACRKTGLGVLSFMILAFLTSLVALVFGSLSLHGLNARVHTYRTASVFAVLAGSFAAIALIWFRSVCFVLLDNTREYEVSMILVIVGCFLEFFASAFFFWEATVLARKLQGPIEIVPRSATTGGYEDDDKSADPHPPPNRYMIVEKISADEYENKVNRIEFSDRSPTSPIERDASFHVWGVPSTLLHRYRESRWFHWPQCIHGDNHHVFSIASIILAVFTFVLLLVALLGTSNKYSLLQDVSFAEYTVDEDGTSVDLDIELGLGRVGYRSIRGTEVSSDTSQVCSLLRSNPWSGDCIRNVECHFCLRALKEATGLVVTAFIVQFCNVILTIWRFVSNVDAARGLSFATALLVGALSLAAVLLVELDCLDGLYNEGDALCNARLRDKQRGSVYIVLVVAFVISVVECILQGVAGHYWEQPTHDPRVPKYPNNIRESNI